MKVQSHLVKLVGTDNQEQAVLLNIESAGVHLTSEKGQVRCETARWCKILLISAKSGRGTTECVLFVQHLERFPFEVIVKWLPSTLRTHNAGTAECFDIQLKTPKGTRELRVKTGSEQQAKTILQQLEATVQALVDQRKLDAAKDKQVNKTANQPLQTMHVPSSLKHAAPSDSLSTKPGSLWPGIDPSNASAKEGQKVRVC